MDMHFLRGDPQTPKGHAIFIAHSTQDPRAVLCIYCIVPPTPLSLAKYLPSFLAAQMPPEELRGATNVNVMPIPPMLEEGSTFEQLQMLAERRNDDLCDIGSVDPQDEGARMQRVAEGCQEYGQLYLNYTVTFDQVPLSITGNTEDPPLLDDMDAEELLLHTMSDRQRLTELGKMIGVSRYALEGNDTHLLQETKHKMQRITSLLAEKFRGSELFAAAIDPNPQGAKLAELYLERGIKLLDEDYADIPRIEQRIRELREGERE